jgi:hypothetical protein
MTEPSIDLINTCIGELNESVAELYEQIVALRADYDARLDRLERQSVANATAAILQARTMPASAEDAKAGHVADPQTALINATRSEMRKPNPPGPIRYGSRQP